MPALLIGVSPSCDQMISLASQLYSWLLNKLVAIMRGYAPVHFPHFPFPLLFRAAFLVVVVDIEINLSTHASCCVHCNLNGHCGRGNCTFVPVAPYARLGTPSPPPFPFSICVHFNTLYHLPAVHFFLLFIFTIIFHAASP